MRRESGYGPAFLLGILISVPQPFSLPSFAKINWTLRVLGKREDGFHELFTVFQTVSLHDTLYFEESDELSLTSDARGLPTDERNLIVKAEHALQRSGDIDGGARIYLEKHIPSPGGLGGGSSNGATALLGLRKLWNADVSDKELSHVAADLGSDVPFFLAGGTAIGTDRGDLIEPVGDVKAENILIVTPDVKISTRKVFESLKAPALTTPEREHILTVCRNEAESLDPLTSALKNDLEDSVFAAFPEVRRVKDTLLELGATNASMCGSGGSVFAVFENKETRQAAEKALDALDYASTWRKFAVSTISRAQYREALGI
jgi:4-diphosphocytidyl-2-C-methyl-D-erythritol kinase